MHHEGCNALCDQLVLAVIDYVLEGMTYIVTLEKAKCSERGWFLDCAETFCYVSRLLVCGVM
jgi:hypothetical protein